MLPFTTSCCVCHWWTWNVWLLLASRFPPFCIPCFVKPFIRKRGVASTLCYTPKTLCSLTACSSWVLNFVCRLYDLYRCSIHSHFRGHLPLFLTHNVYQSCKLSVLEVANNIRWSNPNISRTLNSRHDHVFRGGIVGYFERANDKIYSSGILHLDILELFV